MHIPFLYRRAGAPPAAATTPKQHSSSTSKTISLKTVIVLSTALCSLIPTVVAQNPADLAFAFYDESGTQIGQAFPVPYAKCTTLKLDQIPAGGNYSTIKSSDDNAALNLYKQTSCDFPERSAVGYWSNRDPVSDILAVRWEGKAPADRAPGTIGENSFPPGMTNQTYNPVDDNGAKKEQRWIPDPATGRIVVGIISAVLVIGVAIGVYHVYVAAQFKPPPKKPKKPKTGLNIKKIKKKDAYYKKPVRAEDQAAFQRLQNESPEPYAGAGGRQPALAMTERSRDSQYSEAATFVDWNNQSQQRTSPMHSSRLNGKGYQDGSDSVSIDMRDTSNNNNRSPFASSFSPDLMQFDNSGGRGYGQQQQNQNQSFRGRGGEVLVPMDTLDHHHHNNNNNQYNNNNGRAGAVRRPSSSRSR
ncbi:hypothetical protein BGZ95_002430 [Linnemannia exigua]|uniref:Uncharacterized protein n=1 Tax=Linnemannia exigua TaxID=604196 RepID=A0AAD4D5J6_9FUNG|nr:hypothetical protein BGZ95_002430 [Linnemannia exigua]